MPATTTVHLTSAQAPALVAFRDGFEAEWQLPSTPIATSIDFDVHGPFMVTVVCQEPNSWRTWQVAWTPDDSSTMDGNFTLTAPCHAPASAPVLHVVSGHAVHAGAVHLGGVSAQSATDEWDFHLSVPAGTYDLIATNDSPDSKVEDKIIVQRGIRVNGDTALLAPIDVVQDGTALNAAKLAVDNPPDAASGETLVAAVDLATAATPASRIYLGPVESAKVAPDSVVGANGVQRVTLTAAMGTSARSVRHPLPLKTDDKLTLPEPIGDPTWSFDHGQLSVITALPELDFFLVSVVGASRDGDKAAQHDLDISQNYLDATSLARPIFDTDIPSYHSEWKLDFQKAYSRHLEAQLTARGVVSTSTVDDDVKASN